MIPDEGEILSLETGNLVPLTDIRIREELTFILACKFSSTFRKFQIEYLFAL